MPVDQIPNPGERDALEANGGNGGNGGGGGSSNSNSHNSAQVSLPDIRAIVSQLARTLPAIEGGRGPT